MSNLQISIKFFEILAREAADAVVILVIVVAIASLVFLAATWAVEFAARRTDVVTGPTKRPSGAHYRSPCHTVIIAARTEQMEKEMRS